MCTLLKRLIYIHKDFTYVKRNHTIKNTCYHPSITVFLPQVAGKRPVLFLSSYMSGQGKPALSSHPASLCGAEREVQRTEAV